VAGWLTKPLVGVGFDFLNFQNLFFCVTRVLRWIDTPAR
jgi:hypothetical protein